MHGKECIFYVINSILMVSVVLAVICTSKKKVLHEIKNCVQSSLKCDLYYAVSNSFHAELVKPKHLAFAVAHDAS